MIEKIKVGGINYSVKEKDLSDFNNNDSFRMGQCFETKAEIEISERLPTERKNQTLVHELVHAIFFESGIELENEEEIVNRIGLILYQVLKDNDFSFLKA